MTTAETKKPRGLEMTMDEIERTRQQLSDAAVVGITEGGSFGPHAAPALADLPKIKMSLTDQVWFLDRLLERCQMHDKTGVQRFAGSALLSLTVNDMAALRCISTTLGVFDYYDAPGHVRRQKDRQEIIRKGGAGKR